MCLFVILLISVILLFQYFEAQRADFAQTDCASDLGAGNDLESSYAGTGPATSTVRGEHGHGVLLACVDLPAKPAAYPSAPGTAFFCNFLTGSFSAVSKRIFARKYAFDSIFQALQDVHTFAPLQTQHVSKQFGLKNQQLNIS